MTASILPPELCQQHAERLSRLEDTSEKIVDALTGTHRELGGGREQDGITHKLDRLGVQVGNLEAKLANGGIRLSIHPAVLGFLGVIGAALIGGTVTLIVRFAGG